ncbi:MAG TPA: TRAP transporter small permease subunit [Steroidobacteraceae bacterium]
MSAPPEHTPRATALLTAVGAWGLATSMLVGAASVLARHLGIALPGDIEIMRAAILVTASVAVLSATLAHRHATVHLLTGRLSVSVGKRLERVGEWLSVLFFLAGTCGLAWIMWDLRHAHEQSDILHIPFAPLRWICLAALVGAAIAGALGNRRANRP